MCLKRWLGFLPILIGLSYLGYAWAQTSPHGYTCNTVEVTSDTVPVSIISPSGNITAWYMQNMAIPGLSPVLVFPYNKTVPTAVPSPEADMEIPSGSSFSDSVTCNTPSCREAMGEGWAAVLEIPRNPATTLRACVR